MPGLRQAIVFDGVVLPGPDMLLREVRRCGVEVDVAHDLDGGVEILAGRVPLNFASESLDAAGHLALGDVADDCVLLVLVRVEPGYLFSLAE